jgi:hypothetical protein
MQEKDWTRAFGRCNSWSTRARKSWRRNDRARGKPSQGRARGHPGRSAQAGRPPLQKEPPRLPSSAGKHPSPSSVCVLKFVCLEPP